MTEYPASPTGHNDAPIREAAARWVVRRDRGFTEDEAVEFARWLQADPRHAAAVARSSAAWAILDRIPATAAVATPNRPVRHPLRFWAPLGGLAVAAAIALLWVKPWRAPEPARFAEEIRTRVDVASGVAPESKVLPDGSIVRLNVGGETAEHFTATERGVRLVRGEAHFTVTDDLARPFVVRAGEVEVRAVGTAFNVHLQSQAVDVIVTEGKVQVRPPPPTTETRSAAMPSATPQGESTDIPTGSPMVVAGQRAVVALAAQSKGPRVVVSEVAPADMARALAWRESMLRLGGATLAELAAEFERATGRRLILADPELGSLRIGGRFPGDDVEGFVRVLEKNYGIASKRAADGTLTLRKSR